MIRDIAIDIETLGRTPGSVVAAVALVEFDRHGQPGGEFIKDTLVVELALEDQQRAGLTLDVSTVLWWLRQSEAARALFLRLENGEGFPLYQALMQISTFILGDTAADDDAPVPNPDVNLWGNGPEFDNAMVAALYQRTDLKQPWGFWRSRCLRTLKDVGEALTGTKFVRTPPALAHDALADATAQATDVMRIFDTIRSYRRVVNGRAQGD